MNGVTQDLQSSLMTMAVTGREGVSPAWACCFNCFISCNVSPFKEISESQPEPACRLWRRPGNKRIIYFRRYVPCTELQMSQLITCIGSLLQDTAGLGPGGQALLLQHQADVTSTSVPGPPCFPPSCNKTHGNNSPTQAYVSSHLKTSPPPTASAILLKSRSSFLLASMCFSCTLTASCATPVMDMSIAGLVF